MCMSARVILPSAVARHQQEWLQDFVFLVLEWRMISFKGAVSETLMLAWLVRALMSREVCVLRSLRDSHLCTLLLHGLLSLLPACSKARPLKF